VSSSRLGFDQHGRQVAVVTTRSLWLDIGDVFVVVDGRQLGLLPTQARPPDARERVEAGKHFFDANSAKRARAEQSEIPDEELDEQAALAAAYAEQRRTPPDLLNVAA
jgi:hypothetical protein